MLQVVYTNSKCSDLWEIFYKQNKRFCSYPLFFITDMKIPFISEDKQYIYSENQPYYKVWIEALEKCGEENFIYLQEDFFLYSEVNTQLIDTYTKILNEQTNYSFIRLIRSGKIGESKITPTLFEIDLDNPNLFAMQTSIWKTKDYIKMFEVVKSSNWLENDNYNLAMKKLNKKGLCHYDNENKRGMNHYDSNVYPYIATALVRGKWILSEYSNELLPILNENKIDINIRGFL